MEKINFWSNKVEYTPKTSAQSYLKKSTTSKPEKNSSCYFGSCSSCGVIGPCD